MRSRRDCTVQQQVGLRLPPFGDRLMDLRLRGLVPIGDVEIAIGWHRATGFPWRVVVPNNEDARSFDFAFLASLSCRLWADTRGRMDEVAEAIADFRPRRLIGVTVHPAQIVHYIHDTVAR